MNTSRPDHFRIPGTFNYRDVGRLRTARGHTLRSGVLLRSAHLCQLDAQGHATLRELGVATVHDLRESFSILAAAARPRPSPSPATRMSTFPESAWARSIR